jgi:hypothetical protein
MVLIGLQIGRWSMGRSIELMADGSRVFFEREQSEAICKMTA